ncbi:hypothetical protein [Nonomuraea salmonea]|uniref:Uncharacterized protein n=1 Tax=Nonomuraea salmonea TaxID=46181 RepID=A0ABV5P2M5_9ACTN
MTGRERRLPDCPPWCTACQGLGQAALMGKDRAHFGSVATVSPARQPGTGIGVGIYQPGPEWSAAAAGPVVPPPVVLVMHQLGGPKPNLQMSAEDADTLAGLLERADPSPATGDLARGLREASRVLGDWQQAGRREEGSR